VAFGTVERFLPEDACSPENGDASIGAALSVFGFLVAHALGDHVGPLALPESFETAWPGGSEADDLGHSAVIAEEMLWPCGCDVAAGDCGLEGGDAWPFLDGVDQIRVGAVRRRAE
jgi:hypothetical protein